MKGRNQLLMGLKGSFENMTVTQARDGDAIVKGKITQMTNPNTEAKGCEQSFPARCNWPKPCFRLSVSISNQPM